MVRPVGHINSNCSTNHGWNKKTYRMPGWAIIKCGKWMRIIFSISIKSSTIVNYRRPCIWPACRRPALWPVARTVWWPACYHIVVRPAIWSRTCNRLAVHRRTCYWLAVYCWPCCGLRFTVGRGFTCRVGGWLAAGRVACGWFSRCLFSGCLFWAPAGSEEAKANTIANIGIAVFLVLFIFILV